MANYDTEALTAIFAQRPALHRFPKAMAARVWTEAKSGAELAKRVGELPGFGKQKAQIFVALLAKQFGVRPRGWQEASGIFGENGSFRSVADIIDADSLAKVRTYKQQMKAAAKAGG